MSSEIRFFMRCLQFKKIFLTRTLGLRSDRGAEVKSTCFNLLLVEENGIFVKEYIGDETIAGFPAPDRSHAVLADLVQGTGFQHLLNLLPLGWWLAMEVF